MTATCDSDELRPELESFASAILFKQRESGYQVTPWTWMGFEGLSCDGISYGTQSAMDIVRVSGPTAHDYWKRVYALTTNCSRIDLQVTVQNVVDPAAAIFEYHKAAMDYYANWLRPPTIDLRLSNRSSPTLYFNTRLSSRFGRIYDKGCESKLDHYRNCLRFELQCNGRLAKSVAFSMNGGSNSHVDAACRVHVFFTERNCSLPWASVESSLLSRPRRRTTASRRLRWLSTQVRGCVQELLERGMELEVYNALGLPPPSDSR